MPRPQGSFKVLPDYRLHKASGRAVVTLAGRDRYLGTYGTTESRAAYDRLLGEWLARGRMAAAAPSSDKKPITVVEAIAAFWRHAQTYYRRADGSRTSELKNLRDALRPLNRLYAHTAATEFGPVTLRAVREEMIRLGWCRTHINRQVNRIRHVFQWATGRELLPATVFHALRAVEGLKAGRSEARESPPVVAVAEEHARAVLPFLSAQVKAMVELQLLTGMRPGEVIGMRACDIDTSDKLWSYSPPTHKTAHHGHARQILLGPRAKEIVEPFLRPDVRGFLFSPADAVEALRAKRRAARKTPLSCGNRPGSNVRRRPRRKPGARYSVESYGQAIKTACDKAFPPPPPLGRQEKETRSEWNARMSPEQKVALLTWRKMHRFHPHQLRHTAATQLRKQFGLEAAQVILGHKVLTVTQVYAEKNVEAARRVVGQVG